MQELVEKLLQELVVEADPNEKTQLETKLIERFNNIVVVTMFDNLTESQKKEFLDAAKDDALFDQKIEMLAAEVPGLSTKIEHALENEMNLVRLVFKQV